MNMTCRISVAPSAGHWDDLSQPLRPQTVRSMRAEVSVVQRASWLSRSNPVTHVVLCFFFDALQKLRKKTCGKTLSNQATLGKLIQVALFIILSFFIHLPTPPTKKSLKDSPNLSLAPVFSWCFCVPLTSSAPLINWKLGFLYLCWTSL